jgi:hypothetical protein
MNDEKDSQPTDETTRRQWLLRLGEVVALAGFSGIVPEPFAIALANRWQDGPGSSVNLPPGLYEASAGHLVHALQSANKLYAAPVGSETEYATSAPDPFQPQFFTRDEFEVVKRFVQIVLGEVDASALSQTTQWLDLWLQSAAGVREAARHLDPLHRALAVAYFGEESVRELASADPQAIVRSGIAALRDLSVERYGKPFLELTDSQQRELLASASRPQAPLKKFSDTIRGETIRGYYTSAAGLKELDYKGNAYYAECPGCSADAMQTISPKT